MGTYKGQTTLIEIGKSIYSSERVMLPIHTWGNYFFISKPRNFKTSMAMDIAIKVSKEGRKVCIFDYNGEWSDKVVKRNYKSKNPMTLSDLKILKNFVFKISEFIYSDDYISLGFSYDAAQYLNILIVKGKKFHNNIPSKFIKLLQDLPTTSSELSKFINKYNIDLPNYVNFMTKNSILTHFHFIQNWFWQGPLDKREVYNFKTEWFENQNLIIDLSLGQDGTNIYRARAFCGLILRQIKSIHKYTKGFFIFEELPQLCPIIKKEIDMPSSLIEIIQLTTVLPKQGICVLGLLQNENQVYRKVLDMWHAKVIGIASPPAWNEDSQAYLIARKNRWEPEAGYREVLLYRANRTYIRLIPSECCCEVKDNKKIFRNLRYFR